MFLLTTNVTSNDYIARNGSFNSLYFFISGLVDLKNLLLLISFFLLLFLTYHIATNKSLTLSTPNKIKPTKIRALQGNGMTAISKNKFPFKVKRECFVSLGMGRGQSCIKINWLTYLQVRWDDR